MSISFRIRSAIVVVLAAGLAAQVAAKPIDQIAVRTAGYKDMGAAFKQINDALRGDGLTPAVGQQAAMRIARVAREQYNWFPAGSGPQPGVKTAARAEIWTKPADFRAAQDNFARQAAVFQKAVAGGNADLIRSETRKLGGTCKQCHDTFRQSDD